MQQMAFLKPSGAGVRLQGLPADRDLSTFVDPPVRPQARLSWHRLGTEAQFERMALRSSQWGPGPALAKAGPAIPGLCAVYPAAAEPLLGTWLAACCWALRRTRAGPRRVFDGLGGAVGAG